MTEYISFAILIRCRILSNYLNSKLDSSDSRKSGKLVQKTWAIDRVCVCLTLFKKMRLQ